MRNALLRVGREFAAAREQGFARHPLARFIRAELSADVHAGLGELGGGLLTEGSAGAGNWATVPWVAVFDPMVTETATRGYYVVYLFAADRPVVYLSLNQGATAVMNEFGNQGLQVLRDRAAIVRARLRDFLEQFNTLELDLGSSLRLPAGYVAGHAIGKTYRFDSFPNEVDLRADLQHLTRAYLALTFRGGFESTAEVSPGNTESGDDDPRSAGANIMEVRQYRMHRRIERNPRASREAKDYHGTECQGCGFDFSEKYGQLGQGYIEAHHRRPLGHLEEGVPVQYDVATDFAVLCSNCHRMIHRMDDPSDIEEFRRIVR